MAVGRRFDKTRTMSRPAEKNPVERYVRHARRFGVEAVLAPAAQDGVPPRHLGRLSMWLQRIGPNFKPCNEQRRKLAIALLRDGVDRKTVCRHANVSRTTLWRLEHELPETKPAAEYGTANPGNNGARMFQNEGAG